MPRSRIALSIAILLISRFGAAQEPGPTPPAPTRYMESTVVVVANIDAVVTDDKGNRVVGLAAADFEVIENGVPRPITHFNEIQETQFVSGESSSDADAPSISSSRKVVFFVDNFSLQPAGRRDIFEGARKFIRTVLTPGDEAMIVTSSNGLVLRQHFTSDHGRLEATLNKLEEEVTLGTLRQSVVDEMRNDVLGANNATTALTLTRRYATMLRSEVKRTTDSLTAALAWLGGIEGKKIVVLMTEEMPIQPGIEGFRLVSTGSGGQIDGSAIAAEYSTLDMLESIARAANSANVTLYSICTRGANRLGAQLTARRVNPVVAVPAMKQSTSPERYKFGFTQGRQTTMADLIAVEMHAVESTRASLTMLARATGGRAFVDPSDLSRVFTEIASDLGGYYSIGYRPAVGEGLYPRIEIRPKNARYQVRARESVTQKTARERSADLVTAALFSPIVDNPIGLTLTVGELANAGNQTRVPIQIRIPMDKLTLFPREGEQTARFNVHLRVADDRGGLSKTADAAREVRIPLADLTTLHGKWYTFNVELLTENKPIRVAAGIADVHGGQTSVAVGEVTPRKR